MPIPGRPGIGWRSSGRGDQIRSLKLMPLLEIKNLHVDVDGKQDPQRPRPHDREGHRARHHGPERLGQVDARPCARRQGRLRGDRGQVLFNGENLVGMTPDERAAKGIFLAFQYPLEIPGVATMTFLRTALNAQRRKRGEPELAGARVHEARERARRPARHRPRDAAPRRQCRLLGRREEAQRNSPDGAVGAEAVRAGRDRFRPRHRRAAGRRRRRQPVALARARLRW